LPPSVEAPGFVALEGGDARVEVVPERGGQVRSLHLFGREWLLGDEGWMENAPAAGEGAIPTWVKGAGGFHVPAGGEAREQRPDATLATDVEGNRFSCTWRGTRMPWVLTRHIVVRPDGAVEARYEALTTGRARLPFLWSAMLRFPLTPQSRLSLPVGARLRVAASRGLLERGRTPTPAVDSRWPHMALAGRTHDLSDPWDLPRRTHLSAWLDLGPGRALLKVRQGDEHLTIACDGEAVPYLGLVIDRGGRDTPVGPRLPFARQGTPTLTLRPSLGAPDRYPEALGDWQSIRWLEPGQPRRWTLTIRGGV
jgi:hypothetical protein